MSVLLPPAQDQKVMIMGGGHQDLPVNAVASTAIVDLKAANPTYVAGPPMDTSKMYVSAVILPDSTVFETGGASTTIHNGNHPVYSAQIFDPKTSTWTQGRVADRPPRVPLVRAAAPGRSGRHVRRQPRRQLRDADRDLQAAVPAEEHPRPTITSAATEIALREHLRGRYHAGVTDPVRGARPSRGGDALE